MGRRPAHRLRRPNPPRRQRKTRLLLLKVARRKPSPSRHRRQKPPPPSSPEMPLRRLPRLATTLKRNRRLLQSCSSKWLPCTKVAVCTILAPFTTAGSGFKYMSKTLDLVKKRLHIGNFQRIETFR